MLNTLSYASRMVDDGSTAAMLREHTREGVANCDPIWKKADKLKKFVARKQWSKEDEERVSRAGRKTPLPVMSEIGRVLATFSGRQMMQRFAREYIARHQGAARRAEIMTKIDRAVMQHCDAEQVESKAFKDGPGIQGVSWTRWFVDELSGDKPILRVADVPVWSMMWPRTRELNLRDRPWHRWGSWAPQAEVRERWSEKWEEIRSRIGMREWTTSDQERGGSSRIPWAGQEGNKPLKLEEYYDPHGRAFWLEYEEWREKVRVFRVARPRDPMMPFSVARGMLIDPQHQEDPIESVDLEEAAYREWEKQHQAMHNEDVPPDAMVRRPKLVYRYAFLIGDTVLETDDLDVGIFTFSPMAAECVELSDETHYIGLVEDIVDAQRMKNYMMAALLRDLAINPKGVFVYEQGLFRDHDAALTAFTSPGGAIQVPRGRLSTGAPPFSFHAGGTGPYRSMLEGMLSIYDQAIPRLAGFNPGALGQLGPDLRRISGQVVRAVQDAAMVSNAERFDALRLYRREGGRIFLAFLRLLYDTPQDLVDFIGEEDAYEDVIDPATGDPVLDPATQAPMRQLAIPPKEMWKEDAWQEIGIEEVQPTDDELSALWETLQTQVQLLLQPMQDTGEPLFTSEDLAEVLPKIPAARRQKMLQRIRRAQTVMRRQKLMAEQQAMAAAQQGAPDAGANGQPAPTNGAPPPQVAAA